MLVTYSGVVLSRLRAYLTYANVMATLAVFVALGGGAYAASLPKKSVGTKQLKNRAVTAAKLRSNAVSSAKVRNGSLRVADFATGDLTTANRSIVSANGAYSISTGDTGITLKGPRGTVTFTSEGFQIQPSSATGARIPVKINTVGCNRPVPELPGAFELPEPAALGSSTWNWPEPFGPPGEPDPSPHDHRLTYSKSVTICPT